MGQKRKTKPAEMIVVSVIVLGIIGGFIFFSYRANHKKTADVSSQTVALEEKNTHETVSVGEETAEPSGEESVEETQTAFADTVESEAALATAAKNTETQTEKQSTAGAQQTTASASLTQAASTAAQTTAASLQKTETTAAQASSSAKFQIETVGNPTVSEKTCTVYLMISDLEGNTNIDDGYQGTYSGEWLNGKPDGAGTFLYSGNYFTSGQKEYLKITGMFENGKLTGKALCIQIVNDGDADLNTGDFSRYNFTQILIGTFNAGYAQGTFDMYYGAAGGDAFHCSGIRYQDGVVAGSGFSVEEWDFQY